MTVITPSFSLQNNNVNETSHQHSQKRKEAEHMPQTLVLPVEGVGALLLVGHPSTTLALRFPWGFLTRGALPMQTPCMQHGLSRHGAENRALPSPVDEYCLSQESRTPPQKIPHTLSSVLLQEGGGSHITRAATLLVSVPFVTEWSLWQRISAVRPHCFRLCF